MSCSVWKETVLAVGGLAPRLPALDMWSERPERARDWLVADVPRRCDGCLPMARNAASSAGERCLVASHSGPMPMP